MDNKFYYITKYFFALLKNYFMYLYFILFDKFYCILSYRKIKQNKIGKTYMAILLFVLNFD